MIQSRFSQATGWYAHTKWYVKITIFTCGGAPARESPIFACGCLHRLYAKIENKKKTKNGETLTLEAAAVIFTVVAWSRWRRREWGRGLGAARFARSRRSRRRRIRRHHAGEGCRIQDSDATTPPHRQIRRCYVGGGWPLSDPRGRRPPPSDLCLRTPPPPSPAAWVLHHRREGGEGRGGVREKRRKPSPSPLPPPGGRGRERRWGEEEWGRGVGERECLERSGGEGEREEWWIKKE